MNSVKMLIATLLSIVIQFGLAIAGWGGWRAFFAHPAFRTLAGVTVVLPFFSGGGMNTGEREDRNNRWVLGAFTLISLLMAFFSSYTDRIGFWTLDRDVMRWIGVAVFFAGGLLRIIPAC